jgi:hypothetical protein
LTGRPGLGVRYCGTGGTQQRRLRRAKAGRASPGLQSERRLGGEKAGLAEPTSRHGRPSRHGGANADKGQRGQGATPGWPERSDGQASGTRAKRAAQRAKTGSSRPCQLSPMPSPAPPHPGAHPRPPEPPSPWSHPAPGATGPPARLREKRSSAPLVRLPRGTGPCTERSAGLGR